MRAPEAEFRCRQCGRCCRWEGHVRLSPEDIIRLAEHLGMAEAVFIQRYTVLARNRAGLSLDDQADGACVFLDGTQCRVHAARPDQCRDFNVHWHVPGCSASRTCPSVSR